MSADLQQIKEQTDSRSIPEQPNQETEFKGTFVSVMALGAFVVLMWLAVFILFIVRQ